LQHLLQGLSLPDRYEGLESALGQEVVQVLVPPDTDSVNLLERASLAIQTRGEGLFLPIAGKPGAGKTTFANSLTHFFPASYRPTVAHSGDVTFESLKRTALAALQVRAPNDVRVLPLLIDDRERNPPSDTELATIKRFLRTAAVGVQPVVLWPETNPQYSREMSDRFTEIAGPSPVGIPILFTGPSRETWQDIAINTLRLVNGVDALEDLGVNPRDYDPAEHHTVGNYIRKISTEFDDRRFKLLKETQRPITLVIVYCSESQDPGVLTQLTSSARYGLADSQALVAVTPTSELGRWWSQRRGLLTRAVVQLNVHLFSIPPGAVVGAIRRHAANGIKALLIEKNVRSPGVVRLTRDLNRTDLGKFLRGESIKAYEARGTPAKLSVEVFRGMADAGLVYGRDKELNKALTKGWTEFLVENKIVHSKVTSEQSLGFVPLIPDTAVHLQDGVVCLEYHWRKGDLLRSSNRSDVAGYALKKIRDYVRQLGWTND
jgi:hypothetical protein